jgi:hypothetical protein
MMKNETLLTTGNPKTEKGVARGFLTNILHLAPARLAGNGINTCPMATVGCAAGCLNTAGRGGMFKRGETTNTIQTARIRKTVLFFEQRETFMTKLASEIASQIKRASKLGVTPVFRLNGTSDIRWETVPVTVVTGRGKRTVSVRYDNIMSAFQSVQFYDYTKIANRRDIPANYHLTFSLAEDNDVFAQQAFTNGMNVAAVFRTLPATFMGRTVVNGDETDLRFLDARGVIVGLKAKGRAKKDTTGFVRN